MGSVRGGFTGAVTRGGNDGTCFHLRGLRSVAGRSAFEEEQEELSAPALASGTKQWQRDMVETITRSKEVAGKTVMPFPRLNYAWLAVAAAAIVAVSIGVWSFRRSNSPDAALRLLAKGYTEHRPFDLRYPGAEYGPPRGERGNSRSIADESPAILEARSRIRNGVASNPTEPKWLLTQAMADLLESQVSAARSTLERINAQESIPYEGTLALAMSWFESGEAQQLASDYGQAAELFSVVLQTHPDDPVALFDRALTYERLQMPHEAQTDWERLLKVEPDGGWAGEARTHLESLRRKLNRNLSAHPTGDLAETEPGQPEVFDRLRKGIRRCPAAANDAAHRGSVFSRSNSAGITGIGGWRICWGDFRHARCLPFGRFLKLRQTIVAETPTAPCARARLRAPPSKSQEISLVRSERPTKCCTLFSARRGQRIVFLPELR